MYCSFARDVTAAMLVVKNQKHIYPLGTKLYFHVNFSRKISIVLTPNMAVLSRGCKPRIGVANGKIRDSPRRRDPS